MKSSGGAVAGEGNFPRFCGAGWLALLMSIAPANVSAVGIDAEIASFAYNEPVPISNYLHGRFGPLAAGSDGITRNSALLAVTQGPWQLGYVQRYDYELKASRDAAELYFEVFNKHPLTPGRRYALDLRVYNQRSQGLRVAYTWSSEGLSVTLGASLLDGLFLTQGRLSGSATATGEQEYEYQATVAYGYTRDSLFDRQVSAPDGLGLTTDLRLHWRPAAGYSVDLRIDDLWGRLWWRDAPYTDAVATSQTQRRDEDGYVVFDPTLSGTETKRALTQRLHSAASLELRVEAGARDEFSAGLDASEVQLIPNLGWRRRFGDTLSLGARAYPLQDALGVEVALGPFRLRYASDALSFDDARFFNADVSFGWQF